MPDLDLDPHEWRLKGARRIKPIKPQPKVPRGKPFYYSPAFSILAVIFGIWAACVIAWAHTRTDQNPWFIALVSLGPVGLMLGIMTLFDD